MKSLIVTFLALFLCVVLPLMILLPSCGSKDRELIVKDINTGQIFRVDVSDDIPINDTDTLVVIWYEGAREYRYVYGIYNGYLPTPKNILYSNKVVTILKLKN